MRPADDDAATASSSSRFLPLAKAALFAAAKGGVEVALSAVLPGVGTVIAKALEPVFARLEARLGFDPTASEANAQQAARVLEQDGALQVLVEQSLAPALAPLLDGQAQLSEGVQRILLVLQGNDDAVAALAAELQVTTETLTRGVDLSERSHERLAGDIATRVIVELDRRGEADAARRQERNRRFREHVSRTQARAVELLTEQRFDRASDELRAGLELLEALIEEDPGDTQLTVQLGYFFKSLAQDFIRQGDPATGEEYNDRALEIFGFVAYQLPHEAKSVREYTDAVNGLGNIHYARGRYRVAADYHRLATTIDPFYTYAWHDLFAALYEQARSGEEVDAAGMRHALDMTRRTGAGQPGLSSSYLDDLARRVDVLVGPVAPRARPPTDAADESGDEGPDVVLLSARRAVERSPDDADTRLRAARVLLERGRAEEALESYEAAAQLRPESFEAAAGRGATLVGLGRATEGLAELDRALMLRPRDAEALYNRACARSVLGDLAGALRDLAEAVIGARGFAAVAVTDPDLAALREHPDFRRRFREVTDHPG
ncbi:TPR end-of-group domain-containing protein [Georgenia sp. H159]|uniref:TPR end-of-group domain-containing protein n=1 Tax=Georgenia sp. H159 TaxID=3076115 RepID=UPI002D78243A|nr:tetratricopeptide repeat protein [Georgenia sp. H159]